MRSKSLLSPYRLLSREMPPDAVHQARIIVPMPLPKPRPSVPADPERDCAELLRLVRRAPGRGEVDAARINLLGLQLQRARAVDSETLSRALSMARAWTRPEGWKPYGATPQVVQAVLVALLNPMLRAIRRDAAAGMRGHAA